MSTPISIEVKAEQADPYEIIVGAGVLSHLGEILSPLLRQKKVAVVADSTALAAVGASLTQALAQADIEATIIEAGSGEKAKNFQTLERVCHALLAGNIERDDLILSFGGGAIGDLTGLAANLVKRGVRCCHIPTTLLSQTDSAIGGKTAINSAHGKNLLGTFYPPALVLIDVNLLATLRRRDILCGYAEIVKYGVIGDKDFFAWLEQNGADVVAQKKDALLYAVEKSCRAKAALVAQDVKEQGVRALLNFGHTFGHALETWSKHDILHGESVAIGMVLAATLSVQLGLMQASEAARLRAHLEAVGLPTDSPLLHQPQASKKMLELMAQDKKVKQGKKVFILAEAIGKAFVYDQTSQAQLETLFNQHKNLAAVS